MLEERADLFDQVQMIVPWEDPIVDRIGFDVHLGYVERFWLGVLGPTSTWLLRRLAFGLEQYPGGYEVDLSELGASVGVAWASGHCGPLNRSLQRCIMFGVCARIDGGIAVRRRVPPLSMRQIARLSDTQRAEHETWQRADSDDEHRAQVLAMAMVRVGDSPERVERQLVALGITPATAIEVAELSATPKAS